jgi:hypothetical protein
MLPAALSPMRAVNIMPSQSKTNATASPYLTLNTKPKSFMPNFAKPTQVNTGNAVNTAAYSMNQQNQMRGRSYGTTQVLTGGLNLGAMRAVNQPVANTGINTGGLNVNAMQAVNMMPKPAASGGGGGGGGNKPKPAMVDTSTKWTRRAAGFKQGGGEEPQIVYGAYNTNPISEMSINWRVGAG